MIHYTKDMWLQYVNGSEMSRDSMDAHLAACDDCLELYLAAVEELSDRLPQLTDIGVFSRQIHTPPKAVIKQRKRTWLERPVVQYAIAASITLILVGSGTFQQLFDRYSDISRETEYSSSAAISEQWTNKAGQWLKGIPNHLNQKDVKR